MAEIALISARKARLEAQANKGDARAKEALDLATHPDKFISTTQIGITLIGILNGIFSGDKIKADLVAYLSQYDSLKPTATALPPLLWLFSLPISRLCLGNYYPNALASAIPRQLPRPLLRLCVLLRTSPIHLSGYLQSRTNYW